MIHNVIVARSEWKGNFLDPDERKLTDISYRRKPPSSWIHSTTQQTENRTNTLLKLRESSERTGTPAHLQGESEKPGKNVEKP